MPGRFPARRSLIFDWAILARAVVVWAWALLAGALTIQQATAQALPPAVVACMNEQGPTQRLACYDREVPRAVATTRSAAGVSASATTSATGAAPAPSAAPTRAPAPTPANAPAAGAASTPTTASAPAASEVDAFGMTAQIQRKESGAAAPPHIDKLTAHITALSYQPRGEFRVTLDNGQVWEEAETTSHLPLHAGDDVTIKRGMLGAFYMSSRQALGLRVKRVR